MTEKIIEAIIKGGLNFSDLLEIKAMSDGEIRALIREALSRKNVFPKKDKRKGDPRHVRPV